MLPSSDYRLAFSFFQFAQKLAAVVESTLAVCDDVRRGPGTGLGTGPGHTSGQVQISFFMSGKIVAAATLAVVPARCCYYFAQFCDPLPSRHWQENVRKCLPAVREKRAKRGGEKRGKDMVTAHGAEAAIDGVAPSEPPPKSTTTTTPATTATAMAFKSVDPGT